MPSSLLRDKCRTLRHAGERIGPQHARGRYFGVVQSWHWQDILEALGRAVPTYSVPAWPTDKARARETRFDTTRRDSLGVALRGLDAMMADQVACMAARGTLPE